MLKTADLGVSKCGHEFYLYQEQAYEGLQPWQFVIQDYQCAVELADNEKNRKGIHANIWGFSSVLVHLRNLRYPNAKRR